MAVASLSPVKILSDLGYEMVDIEPDKDYLSAVMEAVNTLTMTNASDLRLPVLQDEVRRVRANRKAADPTFKTRKVSVDKLMGRKTSSAQRIEPQKLLPATSEGESANTNALASRLNNISQSLDNLGIMGYIFSPVLYAICFFHYVFHHINSPCSLSSFSVLLHTFFISL